MSVVPGQTAVTLELRNTPGGKYKEPKVVHACISQLAQFMPQQETYKSEIGSQSDDVPQVFIGAYVSSLAP